MIKTTLLHRRQKGREILAEKQISPAIATQPGFSHARTPTNTLHGRLWLGASEALGIYDFERGAYLNLYRIAHNKSTVDKGDNFPASVARIERSEIRDQHQSGAIVPGFRSAQSGLLARFDQRPCKPLAAFGQSCRTILSIGDHSEHAIAREVCDRDA